METISLPSYDWLILALAICVGLFPSLDRRRFPHRVVASGCTILVTIGYLVWRACFTLDLSSPAGIALSVGFFVLEAISNISAIMVMIVLVRLRLRSQEADDNTAWVRTTMPSVAIFIATYKEDRTILDRTILGALKQDHPVTIYLLDDGRRPEIAALCRDRGVRYLTRADNVHAKAGNMNAGLASLAALGEAPDFIAILDADFVPFPQFISRSLTLFHDPKVGVVQTPQHFFNPDPLQHSLRAPIDLPDEQRFFFDTLLPAKDGWGAAFSCGTSSMVRATALAAVGGFPTDSITEDMLLSMRMKRFGYETAYLNEQLSLGLAPEGLSEYCSQRIRWCIGAMQIVRGADGLRAGNGLAWVDRANLVDTVLY
jgi:cellulose synthase (UDP-forming)